jgi:hypothetical protein
MRRVIFVAIISLLTVGLVAAFGAAPTTHAENLTPEQTSRVKANCSSIKTSLNQLHASDALLRVNRGQMYESVATKLMDRFNDRLSGDRLDNKAMTTVTGNYRTALNNFRVDYIAYEQKLAEAIRIDCVAQPNSFHNAVVEARALRNTVHDDVQKLHRIIDDYRLSVSDFLLNFERLSR